MSDRPTDVSPGSNVPSGADRTASAAGNGVNIEVPSSNLKLTSHAPTVEVGSAYVVASAGLAAGTSSAAAVSAAVSVADRQTAILALEPKFQALPPPILQAIVDEAEPAGPHLGNADFPEELLRALARFEHGEREAAREKQEGTSKWRRSVGEKVLLLILGGIVTLGLKALFFPS